MTTDHIRIAAFCAYLLAWIVLAVAAMIGAMPLFRRQAAAFTRVNIPSLVGTMLQVSAAIAITMSNGDGPLRPRVFESAGVLVLAPLGAALFIWALRSVPGDADAKTLVTAGAYAWLRHPMYLAFLSMLLATGLLISAGVKLIAAAALFLIGSELRIASEEMDLAERFPAEYQEYRVRTKWRYLPGLR